MIKEGEYMSSQIEKSWIVRINVLSPTPHPQLKWNRPKEEKTA